MLVFSILLISLAFSTMEFHLFEFPDQTILKLNSTVDSISSTLEGIKKELASKWIFLEP